MRVNLIAQSDSMTRTDAGAIPLSLTVRPSCGLPGDYLYATDSSSLLKMLRRNTDLPSTVLQRFAENLSCSLHARLLGVELSDKILTEIGYFID